MRAYTIKVDDVAGGGGHVLPGDHVDVLLVQEITDRGAVEGSGTAKALITSLVIQNVRVLGMDLIADPASTEKFPPKTATLEVAVLDAGKLAAAGKAGVLSLSLRRSGATEIADIRPMTLQQMLRSDAGAAAGVEPAFTPRRVPVRRATPRPAASPASRGLVITQGGESATVSVPSERFGS
jgi:pilus assembly protein CpaB